MRRSPDDHRSRWGPEQSKQSELHFLAFNGKRIRSIPGQMEISHNTQIRLGKQPSSRVPISPDPFATPAGLSQLWALEALERIGTAEARRILEQLAEGGPEDPLCREAQLVVGRMMR
jgi:hypothetical protein